MASYDTGEKTKEKILQTSMQLFYKDGYEKTTFNKICKISGINPGSIYYHFKTKHNLAFMVYDNMVTQIYKATFSAFPKENDKFVLYFLSTYVHCYCYLSNSNYRAFYRSVGSNYYNINDEMKKDFKGMLFREDNLNTFLLYENSPTPLKGNVKKWGYVKMVFFNICWATSEFIADRIGEYTIDEILIYWIDIITSILNVNRTLVNEAFTKARYLYGNVTISCGLVDNNFEVKLTKKV